MKHPLFHVGETCYIATSKAMPHFSRLECEVTGPLMNRPCYNEMGRVIGHSMAYKVKTEAHVEEVCAPESMLVKKFQRSDWSSLKTIWQPKREAR